MSSISTGVVVRFGLLTTTVSVESALAPIASNVQVAADENGEIRRIMQRVFAGDREVLREEIQKARVVDGGLIVITEADASIAGETASQFKKLMPVTPHPVAQVQDTTMPGEKAYFLVPSAGHEDGARTLVHLIERHPELAFMARFTVRSKLAIYQLTVHDGVLLVRERIPGDKLRPAPAVGSGNLETADMMDTLAERVLALPKVVQDFDLASYRDGSQEALDAVLEGREVLPDPKRERAGSEPAQVATAMAALEQMLAQATPKKRARRKPANA